MRRSPQNTTNSPVHDLRPYLQRQGPTTGSPKGPRPGIYVAEAVPIKSTRSPRARPFPSGTSFENRSSGGSQSQRLVRSAGILPSGRISPGHPSHSSRTPVGSGGLDTSSVNNSSPTENKRAEGQSREALARATTTSSSKIDPVISNSGRGVRDRGQGRGHGMTEFGGRTESISSNLFSLTKEGRNPPGGVVIALTRGIKARDREYPHHLHEETTRQELLNPGSLSSFSESNPTGSPRVISKVLGPCSPNNRSTSGSTCSNEGPRGEGNRLVVKRRRDGDLEDLEDNTPLGLISFFDGIHPATGIKRGGRGMIPSSTFDEILNKSKSKSSNASPSPKVQRTARDAQDLSSLRARKEFEYNPGMSSRISGPPRFARKTAPATASERQRDIHERYGSDRSPKGSGVGPYSRQTSSYSRAPEEKTPVGISNKTKLHPQQHGSPNSLPGAPIITSSSSSSSSTHPPNTSHTNTNTNTNGIRTSQMPSGKGAAHFIEESRPDNPPLNPSSSSRKELTEIDKRETTTTGNTGNNPGMGLRSLEKSGSSAPPILPQLKDPTYLNGGCSGRQCPGNPNPGIRKAKNNCDSRCSESFVGSGSQSRQMDGRPFVRDGSGGSGRLSLDNNSNNQRGSNSEGQLDDGDNEGLTDNDDESISNSDGVNILNNEGHTGDSNTRDLKKCSKCKVLTKSQTKYAQKIKNMQRNNVNLECLIRQKRELVEQLQQQVKILMRENQHLAKIVVNTDRASSASNYTPNLTGKSPSSTGIGFPIPGKSSTSPVSPINQTLSVGESQENPRTVAHRKSAPTANPSFLSSIHSLNPHRKVAMSPEHVKEAEDKITSLTESCKKLQSDLDTKISEQEKMSKFLSDLLYTLNGRGFEAITDKEGNVVDLNRCKGDAYLDLKGKDQRQKGLVRRVGGNDSMLKAVIGSQEKMIQNLISELETMQRDLLLGNKLSSSREGDGSRVAVLESEILQLMTLLEVTCQRFPDLFLALREQHQLDSDNMDNGTSPRIPSSQTGIVHKLLDRCEELIRTRYPSPVKGTVVSSRGQKGTSHHHRSKEGPPTSGSSRRDSSEGSKSGRPSRRVRSGEKSPTRSPSQPIIPAEFTQSENSAGRSGSGSGTLDNQHHQHHQPSLTREEGHGRQVVGSRIQTVSAYADIKSLGTINGNNPRGSEPMNGNSSAGSIASYCREGRRCPYCEMDFGPEMSPKAVHEHLEAHLFQTG